MGVVGEGKIRDHPGGITIVFCKVRTVLLPSFIYLAWEWYTMSFEVVKQVSQQAMLLPAGYSIVQLPCRFSRCFLLTKIWTPPYPIELGLGDGYRRRAMAPYPSISPVCKMGIKMWNSFIRHFRID